jgi:hypothetical protein
LARQSHEGSRLSCASPEETGQGPTQADLPPRLAQTQSAWKGRPQAAKRRRQERTRTAPAVVRRPAPANPGALALTYLKNELARGPIAASAVDDMVERGRLSAAGVKAKDELGVVALRLNRGRGAVVHLVLPDRAEATP